MVFNAAAAVTPPSVIGEFGKAFNGAGAHMISKDKFRRQERGKGILGSWK